MVPIVVNAGNGGPFTLSGTKTYIVGTNHKVVIDPGPQVEAHLRALLDAVRSARTVSIVVTHWHDDHAGLAPRLSRELGGLAIAGPGPAADRELENGESIATDQGPLVAVAAPGHARHHHVYHWPSAEALFAGDLLLGEGETTWVGEYSGCVADYLASLDTVAALNVKVLYPAHGPAIEDVRERVGRYRSHRLERVDQVARARARFSDASPDELTSRIYGDLPAGLFRAARQSVQAMLHHLEGTTR